MSSKGQMIETNGIRLNVSIHGEGPDVLLLHGFPDSADLWRNQIPALAEAGYRVIAPDLRGSGHSDAPEGKSNYTLDKLIKDVAGLMGHLGVERARVVGHDWGAILGWFFAIEHPEHVDRYVALSVGHPTAYQKAGIAQKLRSWYAVAETTRLVSAHDDLFAAGKRTALSGCDEARVQVLSEGRTTLVCAINGGSGSLSLHLPLPPEAGGG